MTTLSGRHLALAIQAVDFKIRDLEGTLSSLPANKGAELEDLLAQYTHAARALECAYHAAQRNIDNLPAYEKLVAAVARPDPHEAC